MNAKSRVAPEKGKEAPSRLRVLGRYVELIGNILAMIAGVASSAIITGEEVKSRFYFLVFLGFAFLLTLFTLIAKTLETHSQKVEGLEETVTQAFYRGLDESPLNPSAHRQ